MLPVLTDEDFNGHIIRGVIRLLPSVDLARIQDRELLSAIDIDVLEAAARDNRLVLTHDARTMPLHAYDRVKAHQPTPGVIVCPQSIGIGAAIEDIVLLIECSELDEWRDRVVYVPL